ncbi:MAG: peptidoglycan DD-metalloendopeptidase family protein [Bacteroidales bacterium]|jgi:murein DD-endopeptidase MepM/ murein hydrolase activator NlpD
MLKLNRLFLIIIINFLFIFIVKSQVNSNIIADLASSGVAALDTLDTNEQYKKIVLFDDDTWELIEFDKTYFEAEIFNFEWNQDKIHAYEDVKISSLPEIINIYLADSVNRYHYPYVGEVRSKYGYRWRRPHKGVDIALNTGDTVYAAFSGKIRVSKTTRYTGGYGNLVVIRHLNGLETYYGHLSKLLVKQDDIVEAGDPIGLGGSTGRSTGPHLHFETRYQGKAFDPERIFDFSTGEIRDSILVLKKHYFNIYSKYGQTDAQSQAASSRQFYTIKSGDTLSKIASNHGTSVNALCRLNGYSPKKVLRVGSRIRVR